MVDELNLDQPSSTNSGAFEQEEFFGLLVHRGLINMVFHSTGTLGKKALNNKGRHNLMP